MTSIRYAGQETWIQLAHSTQRSRSPWSRLHNLPRSIFLAAAVSVAIILVSFSICRIHRNRSQVSGVTRRELAEGGEGIDEDELAIIEGCLELEEEMGLMEERASSSSERNWSSRVAELVSMLSETAAARESRQERLPVAAQLHLGRQLLERQTVFQPQSSELVALLTRGQSPGGAFRPGGPPLALNPDSWLEEIPSIGGRPEGPEGAGPSSVTAGKSKTGKLLNRRSLRRRRPGGLKKLHSLEDIKEHAYVRLPVLEEGVVPRYIRVPALFDKGQRKFSPHPYLLTLRRLFAKRTLNQQDADILMHAVERMASATLFRGEKVISTPSAFHVVEVLGDYFMIFDAIVCASQVMGKYMQLPLWWGKFTAKVHTSYTVSSAGGNGKKISTFHSNLATRLIAALNIYKRGERPPAEEVFALKALLFCAPMGYHRFKGPKWDPWRKDGDCS